MDFDIEKLLVKASGENVEHYMNAVISDTDKAQIEYAFDEIFSGLSLLHWIKKNTLSDSWKITLDDMRDFIFSIKEITNDYTHMQIDSKNMINKITNLQKNSIFKRKIKYDESSNILVVQTCSYNKQNSFYIISSIEVNN